MMMKKNWKSRSAVSPVIATILMVAITVVLAAVLYVMVMGMGGEQNTTPNVALGNQKGTGNTYDVYVISVSGGTIDVANVEAVVVSGPADVTTPLPTGAGILKAGDRATITASDNGSVTVMFRDKVSGNSLGQTTFTVTHTST